jgi:hypothetical protein
MLIVISVVTVLSEIILSVINPIIIILMLSFVILSVVIHSFFMLIVIIPSFVILSILKRMLRVIMQRYISFFYSFENESWKHSIGLHHPLDGATNPKYKLLHFLTANFWNREEGPSF